MLIGNIFRIFLLFCVTIALVQGKKRRRGNKKSQKIVAEQQNFHEVDAFGDDFVDFGAQTGEHGQFSWHADFPLE
jgi:hypothetical protein